MEDKLKAVTLIMITMFFSGSWAFDSYISYKIVQQQEQTKRMISYDARCSSDNSCKPIYKN